ALQDPLQQNSIPAGFQLYVYDLPAEFNRNIVSCVEQATGGCFRLGSSGMGPEFARHGNTSFRRTHMFALEVILHHKVRHSRHRTLDPRAADAFYIPYYSGLACLCPHLQAGALNRRLVSHLTGRYPYLSRGKPHLMALGKIEREQWSPDCGFLALPEAGSIVFAGIEEEFSPALRAHFGRKGRPLIVAPYPAFGHLISSSHQDEASHVAELKASHIAGEPGSRDVFVFLAASSRNAHRIRTALRPQFRATDRRYSREEARRRDGRPVWLLTPECRGNWEGNVVEWMRHSVFCVQPPGDSPTRKSFYDAVACGCVPVTFTLDHPVRYPFDKVLNYSEFTVSIDGTDVTERNSSILDILRNIPPERIKLLQDNLRKVAPLLQYSYPPSVPSHDAFSMVMAEMARHFQEPRNQ
ncbi:PREDICTED: probable xyloglucan galactosyltransferase GT14, partial [Branchiostoma belcheri]|uniref:Probable xyloglucan galactosyltransferase GT14 n=1 Tax=Branchiostoma belcheri TaxID=7741 RepID=A0A6P4ZPE4_BRABE